MAKKIALISFCTPTFNNSRAASALPYHLALGAKDGGRCDIEIWTYNLNNVDKAGIKKAEEELGAVIHLLPVPAWYRWMFKLHLSILRVFLHFPLLAYFRLDEAAVRTVNEYNPDIVWIYGEELAGLAACFPESDRIVTMPDSESLYYHRVLATDFMTLRLSQVLRYGLAYWQYRSMDRQKSIDGVRYHFVGEADTAFYKGINPASDAVFLRHPHYAWRPRTISFNKPRIRILFAGRYDIFCQHGSDDLLRAIMSAEELRSSYEITFLGRGWERWCDRLRQARWTVNHIIFAPDYIEEIQRHDIQINAIDLGTGTKGKVLDALANGLLAFGTPLALENIDVDNGKSCIVYHTAAEAVGILKEIAASSARYEAIAEAGRKAVLGPSHDNVMVAKQLFRF